MLQISVKNEKINTPVNSCLSASLSQAILGKVMMVGLY